MGIFTKKCQKGIYHPGSTARDLASEITVQGGGINWEIGIDIYTLLYIKLITNKDLLYSTGKSTPYSVMAYMGKESKEGWMYVYV